MSLGAAHSIALVGLNGYKVEVQADLGGGLPGMILLGLPDASLSEARDRVRSAARNAGVPLSPMRLTVNLIPAGLPKRGPGFDLAILLSALEAQKVIRVPTDTVFLGELALDGSLRSLPGVLPSVLAARQHGFTRCVVPIANAEEAGLLPGMRVFGYRHVSDLLLELGADPQELVWPHQPSQANASGAGQGGAGAVQDRVQPAEVHGSADLADVVGQPVGRHALEVAAAGGHPLLLVGPPGAGKTMLAERLPGLLPDLSDEESVEATCVHSLAGRRVTGLLQRPPFEAPHHTSTTAALVGGGAGTPRPGAASMAHTGVLFLDEAPEFGARSLDALREPLEAGNLTLQRSGGTAQYPARFQLVMAANPCPCGKPGRSCECAPIVRRRYWGRLSGPLLDRMDLLVQVPAARAAAIVDGAAEEDSATVRARVEEARSRQAHRWRTEAASAGSAFPSGAPTNARVSSHQLRADRYRFGAEATQALKQAAEVHALTGRGVDRVKRIAWTLADLAGLPLPGVAQVQAAVMLRSRPEMLS